MIRLLPLLVIVFVATVWWLSESQKEALLEASLDSARSTSLTAVDAVRASMMLSEDGGHWDRVSGRLTMRGGADLEILDVDGRVLFPAAPGRAAYARSDPICQACHGASRSADVPESLLLDDLDRSPTILFAAPLRNDETCRGCHVTDGAKLGMVLVRQSAEPLLGQVRKTRLGIVLVGCVVLLLTLLTIRMVLARYLGRPMRALVDGARAIGAGNLERRIEVEGRTELSLLADTLNASTVRLAEMVHRLEHQRDDFEVLYRFTDQVSRAVRPEERRRRVVELATRFLGVECVLVRVDDPSDREAGTGTITMREGETFSDHAFCFGAAGTTGVPSLLAGIVKRWLGAEFDGRTAVEDGWVIAYPLVRSGRRLGLLLVPVPGEAGTPAGSDLVEALTGHVAVALEFTDLQNELVGQERLAAIGETVAGLAHCLKNTLNGLRAGQYVISRGVELENPDKLKRGWGVLKTAVEQVEKLTHDMLYVVKDRVPVREPVDPNAVVREVMAVIRPAAARQEIEIVTDLDETIGEVALDRLALYRALLNLVSNAIDACAESEEGARVVASTRREGEEVVLSVSDDGVGMTEEVRSTLFTRFFTTKAGKGTGLGLPVVKKVAEEHGGRISFDSEPGRGSTFRIHLPRDEDPDPGE